MSRGNIQWISYDESISGKSGNGWGRYIDSDWSENTVAAFGELASLNRLLLRYVACGDLELLVKGRVRHIPSQTVFHNVCSGTCRTLLGFMQIS